MGNQDEGIYALKKLEHEHADEGQLEDIAQSDALATDQSALATGYWLSLPMLGAIFSIGMGTTSSYMGFSPPAAILTYINADIGMIPSVMISTYTHLCQAPVIIRLCLPLFGPPVVRFLFCCLEELQTSLEEDGLSLVLV